MMTRSTFILVLGTCAYLIGSGMAGSCTMDEPGDQDGNPCTGQPLVMPLPTGGSACCSSYGGISLRTKTYSTGDMEIECTCPSSQPTSGGSGPAAPTRPKVPVGQPTTGGGDLNTFRQQALQRHNQLRAKHGSPPSTEKNPRYLPWRKKGSGPAAPTRPKVPVGQPTTGGGDLNTFRQQALQRHNQLRAKHGSPPLTLSDDLNAYAQNWAEHMAQIRYLTHSDTELPSGESVGENLAMKYVYGGRDYANGGDPVQSWYDEIKDYDYNNPLKGGPLTGHFTQVVWKSTTELGMGKARSADGTAVYVCGTYRGPGNIQRVRYYNTNVPRLL